MSLKNNLERGVTKKFLLKGTLDLEKGGGKYFKKGEFDHNGVEKKREGCNPQRN